MKKLMLCVGLLGSLCLTSSKMSVMYGQFNTTLGVNVLSNNTTGSFNVGIGDNALRYNTTGSANIATGYDALRSNIDGEDNVGIGINTLYNNTGGSYNTGLGSNVLFNNTTGNYNIGIGANALLFNKTGSYNTGIGVRALYENTTGYRNVGVGVDALRSNTTGYNNTGVGNNALSNNTIGTKNTGISYNALYSNSGGYSNVGVGSDALFSNTSGHNNIAIGVETVYKNTTGDYNVGLGNSALYNNTTGGRNTALGVAASRQNTTGYNSTAIGYDALRYNTTGTGNTALGYKAMATSAASAYSYSVALGAYSLPTASYQVRVGYFGTSSIGGTQNWTNLSDGRFKKEVEEDVMGLDFIKALRPVSYYVDNAAVNKFLGVELEDEAINNKKQYQTGFIAQEVEATAKELGFEHFGGVDAPANDNSHYGLRYAEFVVPLVKSVQELSQQNEKQTTTIEAQTAAIESLKELVAQQQVQIDNLLNQQNTALSTRSVSIETKAALYQNTPNPFTNETQIKLFVPTGTGQALIQVCTIDGKQLFVKEVEGRQETSVLIEGNNLAPGIYMYTLIVDNEVVSSRRMVLTK